jgi:hypothetical protein
MMVLQICRTYGALYSGLICFHDPSPVSSPKEAMGFLASDLCKFPAPFPSVDQRLSEIAKQLDTASAKSITANMRTPKHSTIKAKTKNNLAGLWVAVKVERGFISVAKVFESEKAASQTVSSWRKRLNLDYDEAEVVRAT